MKIGDIQAGDQMVKEGTDRVFWTAKGKPENVNGAYVRLVVMLPDGTEEPRVLFRDREVVVRRGGKLV